MNEWIYWINAEYSTYNCWLFVLFILTPTLNGVSSVRSDKNKIDAPVKLLYKIWLNVSCRYSNFWRHRVIFLPVHIGFFLHHMDFHENEADRILTALDQTTFIFKMCTAGGWYERG
jgi:hypothetical protein